jgi:hypothetical protein
MRKIFFWGGKRMKKGCVREGENLSSLRKKRKNEKKMEHKVLWIILIIIILIIVYIMYNWFCITFAEEFNSPSTGFEWLDKWFKKVAIRDIVPFGQHKNHPKVEYYQPADEEVDGKWRCDWKVEVDGKWRCDIKDEWTCGKQPLGIKATQCDKVHCVKTEIKANLAYALRPEIHLDKCPGDLLVGIQVDNQLLDVYVNGVYMKVSHIRNGGCNRVCLDESKTDCNTSTQTTDTYKTMGIMDIFEFIIPKHLLRQKNNEIIFLLKNNTNTGYVNLRIQELMR